MKKKIYGLEVVGGMTVSTTAVVTGALTAAGGLALTGNLTWRQKPTAPISKAVAYTAVAGDLISFDTTAGAFTITMDAAPQDKDEVGFVDVGGWVDVNNLILDPNGKKILGETQTIGVDMNYIAFTLKYNAATNDWRLI